MLDETAAVKASEDAKRQRELKKFGKKVQVEKIQERQKKKTEEMDKIKMLKRSKLKFLQCQDFYHFGNPLANG